MTIQGPTRAARAMLILLVACASAAPAGEQRLIEGFENLAKVSATPGLSAVTSGKAVTEGKQAAQLPPDASISLKLTLEDCRQMPWLRIDTFPAEPLSNPLKFELLPAGSSGPLVGWVKPGNDTVSLPLSTMVGAGDAPDGEVTLNITNPSTSPIILDNIRMDAGCTPPEGAVLIDFGSPQQRLWPGFEPNGATSPVVWSYTVLPVDHSPSLPDPLTGDCVGPRLSARRQEYFTLRTPGNEPAVAWLWVTHYGLGLVQAQEHGVKVNGKVVHTKLHDAASIWGPDGIQIGRGGDWTSEWFDKVHAPKLFKLIRMDLKPGDNRIDLLNCQIAALAMAPASTARAMEAYVQQVLKDLSQFRRQFVVAQGRLPVCDASPTEDESRSGVMFFQAAPDEAFTTDWTPGAPHRITAVKLAVAAGSMAMAPLAVVPLKKQATMTVSFLAPVSAAGRALPVASGAMEASWLECVPRVEGGQVNWQPWIISPRIGGVSERQVAYLALVVAPPPRTPSGLYKGNLRFHVGPVKVDLPLEVQVHDVSAALAPGGTHGTLEGTLIANACPTLAAVIPPGQAAALTVKARTALLSEGLDALMLSGPRGYPISESSFVQELQAYPAAAVRGTTFVDCAITLRDLGYYTLSRTQEFRAETRSMVDKVGRLSATSGLRKGLCIYLGPVSRLSLEHVSRDWAEPIVASGGKAAVLCESGMFDGLKEADLQKLFAPISTMVIRANEPGLCQNIQSFKSAGGERVAYVLCSSPDRYLAGFFSRSAGADGVMVGGVFLRGGHHDGRSLNGNGLIAPTMDGGFAPTLVSLFLRQGIADYQLMLSAEALVERAGKAGVDASELSATLEEIRSQCKTAPVGRDSKTLRQSGVGHSQLECWRLALSAQAADLAQRLQKPKPN